MFLKKRVAVVLTAIPTEYKSVRAYLSNLAEEVGEKGTVYERGSLSVGTTSWEIGLAEVGTGTVSAALEAQRAIDHFRPDIILFVGVAGGLKDVRIGDVVVSTKIYGYESGKAGTTFLPRAEVAVSDYRLVQRARAEARRQDWHKWLVDPIPSPLPRVYVGPIAAGEKVVVSTKSPIYRFLATHYSDALAVEMEGVGFLRVANENRVPALVIRGISDLIDNKNEMDTQGSQQIASRHASAFAFSVLVKIGSESPTPVGLIAQSRWVGIDCSISPRDIEFVRRERLMAEVRRFVDHHDSGYFVIVGGMGRGKSAFLTELIHTEDACGEEPVYHIIGYEPSVTAELRNIAGCLYYRLCRKYDFLEPSDWEGQHIEDKLERLLKYLSETILKNGHKEVLYIDAADQSQANADNPLVSGVLRNLPRGVFCIITSRTHLEWLHTSQAVTVCKMDDFIDDRADVREYLQRQALRLSLPLSDDFIEQIVTQSDQPVFFTVVSCLRRLKDKTLPDSEKTRLQTDPSLWVIPPEELTQTEAMRIVTKAKAMGISENQVWQTLGVLAVAREEVSEEHLDELGLWQEGITDRILKLASNFFRQRPVLRAPDIPYRFDHSGYHREVLDHLKRRGIADCHRLLARGCWRCWSDPNSTARLYALRHLPAHLCKSHLWGELCEILTDFNYLQTKIGSVQLLPAKQNLLPFSSIYELLRDFHDVVYAEVGLPASHTSRDEIIALYRAIDANAHVLNEMPCLLVQQLYNFLVWDWGEKTLLGRKVRDAAMNHDRIWLAQLNRPATDSAPLRKLKGHRGEVLSLTFSPDGETLVSAGNDRTLKFWDVQTGELKLTIKLEEFSVNSVVFSPDGKTLATGGRDSAVRIWDTVTKHLKLTLMSHQGQVNSVAFLLDGSMVASGSEDNTVKLWDVRTGSLKSTLGESRAKKEWEHTSGTSVAFSPDGSMVASGGEDNTVKLWDVRTCSLKSTLGESRVFSWERRTGVTSVAFSPDGRMVVSGSEDNTLRLWDTKTGDLMVILEGHTGGINSVAFSPDGSMVASGSDDNTVRLWDVRTGELKGTLTEHGRGLALVAAGVPSVAFSPDSKTLATGGADCTIMMWNLDTQKLQQTLETYDHAIICGVFSPDGKTLATGHLDTVRFWNIDGVLEGKLSERVRWRGVKSVAFSPDAKVLARASLDEKIGLWDLRTRKLDRTLRQPSRPASIYWRMPLVAFSPNGEALASGNADGTVRIWDVQTGKLNRKLIGHSGSVESVTFSPDGKTLASSGKGDAVMIWDARTWELKHVILGNTGGVYGTVFSVDGANLATLCYDSVIRIWELKTWKLIQTLKVDDWDGAISVVFSPDGRLLASGYKMTVRLWDIKTGEVVTLLPCIDEVITLRFDSVLQLRVADAGGGRNRPNIQIFQLILNKVGDG